MPHPARPLSSDLHPTLSRLDDLAAHLSADPDVQAVLGLGSAGAEWQRFDDHSDIDFFVVVADGETKQRLLADVGWLEGFGGRVAYSFVNDPNGRKALLEDDLFLEYAVFTPAELAGIPVHDPRIVWSRPHFVLPDTSARTAATSPGTQAFHVDEALTNLYVGLHRHLRGERLAAMRLIQVHAVDHVLALVRDATSSARPLPDPFNPARRAEEVPPADRPPLAEMVAGYEHNASSARAILGWLTTRFEGSPAIVSRIEALLLEASRADEE